VYVAVLQIIGGEKKNKEPQKAAKKANKDRHGEMENCLNFKKKKKYL